MPAKSAVGNRSARRTLFLKMIDDLKRERDELVARVAELDSELAEYGAQMASGTTAPAAKRERKAGAKKRGPRPSGGALRTGSLKDYIMQVVGSSPMTPADIATAVVNAGYKTTSKTLAQSVSVACAQLVKAGHVKKEGRGKYRAA